MIDKHASLNAANFISKYGSSAFEIAQRQFFAYLVDGDVIKSGEWLAILQAICEQQSAKTH